MGAIIEDAGTRCFSAAPLALDGLDVICTSTSLKRRKDLMIPCCLHQFVTFLSTCPCRRRDSSLQATVSNLPFQFWSADANRSLDFLLSADRKGTRSGLTVIWIGHLDILTCCAAEAFVYDDRPHTSVVFELLWLVSAVVLHPFPQTTAAHWVLSLVGTILLGYNEVKSSQKVPQSLGTL